VSSNGGTAVKPSRFTKEKDSRHETVGGAGVIADNLDQHRSRCSPHGPALTPRPVHLAQRETPGLCRGSLFSCLFKESRPLGRMGKSILCAGK